MTRPRLVDIEHLGTPRAIGAWIVDDAVLVDPGPATGIPGLLEGLGDWRPRAVALTHIHLDHAGACGSLLRHWPGVEVWVHRLGAGHLVNPARLVRSARRVYGDELDALWGEPEPVPAAAVRPVDDGTRVGPFEVAHTPGHASHHVSYLHHESGVAFVGDVAGVRIAPCRAVLAPAVPPEFDPALWAASLDRVAAWRPASLAVTHFGLHDDVDLHLAAVRDELEELVATRGRARAVRDHLAAVLRREPMTADAARAYHQAAQPQTFAAGIRRHLEIAG
jgi:glyoxylase-like metal-dependent hydrolase (beta-lactamase superfamily II)